MTIENNKFLAMAVVLITLCWFYCLLFNFRFLNIIISKNYFYHNGLVCIVGLITTSIKSESELTATKQLQFLL